MSSAEAEENREEMQEAEPLNQSGLDSVRSSVAHLSTEDKAEENCEKMQEAEPLDKSELNSIEFTWVDMFQTIVSFIFYIADVVSDGVLAIHYHSTGQDLYFCWTLFLILGPALIMSFLTIDEYRNQIKYSAIYNYPSPSKLHWAFRMFCLVLGISPLPWYVETIYYGLKYNKAKRQEKEWRTVSLSEEWEKKKESYAVFLYVDNRSTSVLRLIEGFFECAPQMMLQLSIMATGTSQYGSDPWTVGRQYFSIITSTCSMAWAVVSAEPLTHMVVSISKKAKERTLLVKVILFLGHLLEISARLLAIGMSVSALGPVVWLVVVIHAIVMLLLFVWELPEDNQGEEREVEFMNHNEKFLPWESQGIPLLVFFALAFSFTYSNTWFRKGRYFTVSLFVNTLMIVPSLWSASEREEHLYIIGHYVLFFFAVLILVIGSAFETRLNQISNSLSKTLQDRFSRLNCCKSSETVETQEEEDASCTAC